MEQAYVWAYDVHRVACLGACLPTFSKKAGKVEAADLLVLVVLWM